MAHADWCILKRGFVFAGAPHRERYSFPLVENICYSLILRYLYIHLDISLAGLFQTRKRAYGFQQTADHQHGHWQLAVCQDSFVGRTSQQRGSTRLCQCPGESRHRAQPSTVHGRLFGTAVIDAYRLSTGSGCVSGGASHW